MNKGSLKDTEKRVREWLADQDKNALRSLQAFEILEGKRKRINVDELSGDEIRAELRKIKNLA